MPAAKKTDAQKIEAIAERNGWDYYPAYSGRCMFGATCPGIVCPSYEVKRVLAAVKRAGIKDEASGDSMGLDAIVYWSFILSDPDGVQEETDES